MSGTQPPVWTDPAPAAAGRWSGLWAWSQAAALGDQAIVPASARPGSARLGSGSARSR